MPIYTQVDFDYRPYGGERESEPFARSRQGFSASGLGQVAPASGSERQAHFEAELRRVGEALGTNVLPVFISFNGQKRRMDKGCVGHAVTRGFLEQPSDGSEGVVTSVTLRQGD
jgi:hypothetical protein